MGRKRTGLLEPRSAVVWPRVTRCKNQCDSWVERSASSKLCWLVSKNTLFTCFFQTGQFFARLKCVGFFFFLANLSAACLVLVYTWMYNKDHVFCSGNQSWTFPLSVCVFPLLCVWRYFYIHLQIFKISRLTTSIKSNKSYQLIPKCILLTLMAENTFPWAWSSQAAVWPSRCVPRS